MSSKGRSEVKLISESFIRPKHELEPSKHLHYLGPIDLYMLPVHPMQKGLLFHSKPEHISAFLAMLEDSLSFSLLHFYPLAGRFTTQKFPNEHASSIYVDCIKGPGAGLLHASVDLTVLDVLSSVDVHPMVRLFFDLGERTVNHDGHIRPLLSVQVTELQDGMFIGFTMNHSAGDGTSLWHFISSLSEIFLQLHNGKNEASLSVSKKPIYGPILPEGYDLILKLPYLESEEFVLQFEAGPLRERIFHFSSSAITKLKTKAQAEAGSEAYKISSFQALCAFLWRFVTKARKLEPNEETTCTIVINFRSRINPPSSETQFGNMIIMAPTSCKIGELLGHDLGWGAKLINRSIMVYDDKRIRECVSSTVKEPHVAQTSPEFASYMRNNLWVGGSMWFDMYGPEFGLGPAVAVLAGFANKHDGKVVANPGCEGGGSVDLEVCLEPNVMEALELDGEFMSFVSSN